jgi:hypothetical protein
MKKDRFICSFFPSILNVNIIIIPIKSLSLSYKAVTKPENDKHRGQHSTAEEEKQKGTFSEVINKYHNENRLFNVLFRFLSLFVVIMVISLLVFFLCHLLIRGILNSNLNYSEAISSLSLFSFLLIEN